MELLYLWIEEHHNIKKQGFNFSPNWRFSYDPQTTELSIVDYREQCLSDFFGKTFSNVTAIVGENGSGKSQLLKAIGTYLAGIAFRKNFLFIVWINQQLSIVTDKEVQYSGDLPVTHFSDVDEIDYSCFILMNSNIMDFNSGGLEMSPSRTNFNISTSNLLSRYQGNIDDYYVHVMQPNRDVDFPTSSIQFPEVLDLFSSFETYCQLDFLFSLPKLNNTFPYLPSMLSIHSGWAHYIIPAELSMDINDDHKRLFLCWIMVSLVRNLIMHKHWDLQYIIASKNFEELERAFISLWFRNEKCIRSTILFYELTKSLVIKDIIKTDLVKNIAYLSVNDHPELTEQWFRAFQKNVFITKGNFPDTQLEDIFININWGQIARHQYSTGELFQLSLFSRLYRFTKQITNENLILLLDEFGAGLHPQWQKEQLKLLLDLLPVILRKNEHIKNVQLILATHSPFVLSDLPKENCIFLSKNDQGECQVQEGLEKMEQTFGANIHTLFSDGFFLDGLLGSFAKSKIDKVNKFLNQEVEMEESTAAQLIDLIGEPIIRRYLKQRLEELQRNAEIQKLEAKIKELEEENEHLKHDQDPA